MGYKYNSLEELRRKKELLKNDVSQLEDLLKFENPKESLSAMTNGLTDQYLKEGIGKDGKPKLGFNTNQMVKSFSSNIKDKIVSKDPVYGIANSAMKGGAMQDAINLGVIALIGGIGKKNMKSNSWKKKLLGAALIYLVPIAIKYLSKRLENYQKNKSVSSMEKLI